jgi:ferredoxin
MGLNLISESNNLYTKFVLDRTDLTTIKHILSDYYKFDFDIDTDPVWRDRFENGTFNNWIVQNQRALDWYVDNNTPSPEGLGRGISVRTLHLLSDNTCMGIDVCSYNCPSGGPLKITHNYGAIHPDYRGQGHKEEETNNSLNLVFNYHKIDMLELKTLTNYTPSIYDSQDTVVDTYRSSKRGSDDQYKVKQVTNQYYLDAVSDPNSSINNYTYSVEIRDT